ncbi:DUF937 domain-containing protein [uncultured Planktosalinus sp.]|uniref:DUF937 domain-containing protein n=1 Tax=uncultured Planktosalinus sp. TaxID=1810935 RepID=UPI0030DA15F8
MSTILELLNSDFGQKIIMGASSQTNAPKDKTTKVISIALPLLLGAMKKNASEPTGAKSLLNALQTKHDGSIVNNIDSYFQGGVNQEDLNDGEGILNHVLGSQKSQMVSALSLKTGLDNNSVAQILKVAAPIVIGLLGKEAKNSNVTNESSLTGILGNLIGGKSQEEQSLLHSLLDQDGDGSVIDDIAGMLLNGNDTSKKKSSGLGGLLGGLFKK